MLFDNVSEVIHDRVDIFEVRLMTEKKTTTFAVARHFLTLWEGRYIISVTFTSMRIPRTFPRIRFLSSQPTEWRTQVTITQGELDVNYTQDEEGVKATYAVMCEAITSVRKCKRLDSGEWRDRLDKDNKRRKK